MQIVENFSDGDVALARALRTVPSMIAKTSSPIGFLTRAMPLPATPNLTPATTGEPVAAVAVVDRCWRAQDTAVLTTAGWTTGTQVHFTADATGLLARTATADDPDAVCATIDGCGPAHPSTAAPRTASPLPHTGLRGGYGPNS